MIANGPERSAKTMLVAAMVGVSYVSYFGYRTAGPHAWDDLLAGRGAAPEQYRVAVLWLASHLPVAMPYALTAIDCVSGVIALLVLFGVLERTAVYRSATLTMRWCGATAFVMLVMWFLFWLQWIAKPETLPAAMFVALMLRLWQRHAEGVRERIPAVLRSAFLVLLSAALATVRADVACALNAGVCIVACVRRDDALALRRWIAVSVSAFGAVIALGIQMWLMRGVYPNASYGAVKLWQLWPNLHHASRWPPLAVFMLPLVWMTVQVARKRFARDAVGMAVLAGALVYSVLWLSIGKVDEVRIFLPFALALAPLTAEIVMLESAQQQQRN